MGERTMTFEDVNVGDEAPVITHKLTRTDLVRYAGASGDFNPMHHDEVGAKAAGQPSVFGHGMFSMGLLGTALTDYVGVGNLTRYQVRFARQTWPEEVLSSKIVVTAKREERRQEAHRPVRLAGERRRREQGRRGGHRRHRLRRRSHSAAAVLSGTGYVSTSTGDGRAEGVVVIMGAELLSQGFASTGRVLAGVSPEQLDTPTPCAFLDRSRPGQPRRGRDDLLRRDGGDGRCAGWRHIRLRDGRLRVAFKEGAARAVAGLRSRGCDGEDDEAPVRRASRQRVREHRHGRHLHPRLGPGPGHRAALRPRSRARRPAPSIARDSSPTPCGELTVRLRSGPRWSPRQAACPADQLAAFLGRRP